MAIIKVLCAEDDRLMRLEMKEKMTAKGWEVIEAVDGKEALVKYKKYRPDIVVLDVNMPKRSGLEVLQLIRVNDLQTPVVIYSSLAEEKDLKIGLCQGAQVYPVKLFRYSCLHIFQISTVWRSNQIPFSCWIHLHSCPYPLIIDQHLKTFSTVKSRINP